MKKFRFPLRSVATVRSLAELKARERFSAAVQVYMQAEQRLSEARALLKSYEDALCEARTLPFRAADQASFIAAIKTETVRATKIEGEVSTSRAALEAARQAWLESRRDVRVIENLEAKAKELHRQEVERENQAAMDDRASALAARNAQQPA